MPNLRITAHGHHFEVDGVSSVQDVETIRPFYDAWIASITPSDVQLEDLARKLEKSHAAVEKTVAEHSPSTTS